MIGHDERNTMIAMNLAPELSNGRLRFEQRLRRKSAERKDDLRTHQLDLTNKIRRAGGYLLRHRIPVTRGSVLEDVRNEDIVTSELDRFDDLREQLACLPYEGHALLILVGARRLPHDHEVRVRVA